MSGEGILNAVRGQAERIGRRVAQPRFALVDGVDPATHTVRVRYQPEDALSGWLPVAVLAVGAGWGLHALPSVGSQVVVTFHEGSAEAGVVTGAVYSDAQPPPQTEAGAINLVSSAGARIRLNADGSADLEAAGNLSIKATGDLSLEGTNVSIKGNVAITGGNLSHQGKNVGSNHIHSGVAPGGANSGPPL